MKKLTAGILTVMLGLVSVEANAAVTSKAYVDTKVGAVQGSVTTLQNTVNEFTTNIGDTITNQIKTELTSDTSDIAKALADKAAASDVTALTTRVTTAENDIDDLQSDVEALQALTGEGEGSVAGQIAGALADYTKTADLAETYATKAALGDEKDAREAKDTELEGKIGTLPNGVANVGAGLTALQTSITNITSDENGILTQANTYTDTQIKAVNDTIGEVAEGKDVVTMISDVETAYKAADKDLDDAVKAVKETADNAIQNLSKEASNGKYVLTAVKAGDQTTYAWEVIERDASESAAE